MDTTYGYVTFVMGNGHYLNGAKVLATSLMKTNSKFPIILFVTPDVVIDAECLMLFDEIITINYITHKCKNLMTDSMDRIYGSWIEKSFTKLNVFNEKWYSRRMEKIIYLDADQIVLENLDHLFNLPTPAMSFDSEYSDMYFIQGINNPFKHLTSGDIVPYKMLRDNFYKNIVAASGTMIISPNQMFFDRAIAILKSYDEYGHKIYNGFDEQLIAETLIDLKINSTHISKLYCWNAGQYQALRSGMAYVINYYGRSKPWLSPKIKYFDEFIWEYFFHLKREYTDSHLTRRDERQMMVREIFSRERKTFHKQSSV
ncbi:MAG: hypothetical protein ACRYGG_14795 [Janthinobacterium lividum]